MTFINNGKSLNWDHSPTSKFSQKGYSSHNWFGEFREKWGMILTYILRCMERNKY